MLGSEEAIHRILSNLISNAVRYGSAGGYIGLTLREDETYAFVDIVDKGRGIERAFAASVLNGSTQWKIPATAIFTETGWD